MMLIIQSVDFQKTWFEDTVKKRVFNFIIDNFLDTKVSFFFFTSWFLQYCSDVSCFQVRLLGFWLPLIACHQRDHVKLDGISLFLQPSCRMKQWGQCFSFCAGRHPQVLGIIFYRKKIKSVYPLGISMSVVSRIILL